MGKAAPHTSRHGAYLAIAAGGLALDAAIVALGYQFGLSLGYATALGYGMALVATYLANERWSFARHKPHWKRAALYATITLTVGVGRVVLAHLLDDQGTAAWLAWGLAVGASFTANWVLVFAVLGKPSRKISEKTPQNQIPKRNTDTHTT